ncbi:glycosyltransferase [Chryseobacterium gossypii]|uniref:glycosyltransferase n=1 Tax=Chryseobacterium gossypii TaxID=3231602 RepID=UPI003525AA17
MILFGLVCFREKYNKSITFIDLKNSYKYSNNPNKKLNLFVFDNTDSNDWCVSFERNTDGVFSYYFHDPKNPGISYAYNEIAIYAKKNGYQYIIFLDQDTHLPIDFYDQYYNFVTQNNVSIAVPVIMNGNLIFSPSKYKNYRSINLHTLNDSQINAKTHTCINSGLLVETSFFFKVGGYNNSLRVDFCDHEFIRRVSKHTDKITILPVILKQSFSTEVNSLDKAVFRYRIFLRDLFSFKKINNSSIRMFFFIDLPHLIRLTWQYKTLRFIRIRLQK